jgi:hypothetical protein
VPCQLRMCCAQVTQHPNSAVGSSCCLLLLQTLLAAGLLNFTNLSPRAIGFIGTVTSGLNCYMLMPPMPKAKTA